MSQLVLYLLLGLGLVAALPPPLPLPLAPDTKDGYSLPQYDPNPSQRAQEVASSHAGYLYGPSLIGNSSFFPSGPLGNQRVASDVVGFERNAAFITEAIEKESEAVIDTIKRVSSFLASFMICSLLG